MNIEKTKNAAILFADLLRLRNALIAFIGVFVGATFIYTAGLPIPWPNVFIAGIAAFLVTGAGNTLNDYFDYEIDRINKPERPIPSGRISRSDAFMLAIVLFLLGAGFSKYVNEYCLIIAALNSVILAIYAKYSKRLLFVSNLAISFLVSSLFIFGVAATLQDNVEILELAEIRLVGILSACAFLITLSREIIKDIEDIKGDRHSYAVTLPIKIGVDRSKKIAIAFTIIAIAISLAPFLTEIGRFNIYIYGFVIFVADLVFLLALTMHPSLSQRTMIGGMILALTAFFLGNVMTLV